MYKRKKNVHYFYQIIFLILKYGLLTAGVLIFFLLSSNPLYNYLFLFASLFLSFVFHRSAIKEKESKKKFEICAFLAEIKDGKLSKEQIQEHKLFEQTKEVLSK